MAFIVSSFATRGQHNLQFGNLGLQQGLSDESVTCITQDSKGFIWVGTTQGVNRFDAYNFKVYKANPNKKYALKSNMILSIFEDSHKTLWVGTDGGGLHYYDSLLDDFHPVTIDAISRENRVRVIFEDSNKNLWLGNMGVPGGIGIYDHSKGEYTPYNYKDTDIVTHNSQDQIMAIHAITQGHQDKLWVGTFFDGLLEFNLTTKKFYKPLPDSLTGKNIISLFADSTGNIWIGTPKGIFKYNPTKGEFSQYLSGHTILSICEDKPGYLWIATNAGLYYLDVTKEITCEYHHSDYHPTSLSNDLLSALYKDRSGLLWVGTSLKGVSVLESTHLKFETITKSDPGDSLGIGSSRITSLLQDSKQTIWIGTRDIGLLKQKQPGGALSSSKFFRFDTDGRPENRINTNGISSLMEDHKGNIWIGHIDGGINIYNPSTQQVQSIRRKDNDSTSLNEERINSIFQDSKKRIWVATLSGGILIFDSESRKVVKMFDRSTKRRGERGNSPSTFFEDSKNRIWIGYNGQGALDRYDEINDDLVNYNINDSINTDIPIFFHNSVSSIIADRTGQIWIGTNNGLFAPQLDSDTLLRVKRAAVLVKRYKHYSEQNGLASNEVCGLILDGNNGIWISTGNGLSYLNLTTNAITNYDERDGLQPGKFNDGCVLKAKNGTIMFGGFNGLSLFHPDSIRTNTFVPPIYITEIKIHNESLSTQNDESATDELHLEKAIGLTKEIELLYHQNSITFEFTALNYFATAKNQYSYTLENFDESWVDAGNQRTATYTNLNPGTYIFKVKASNNDGVWNEKGHALRITIFPPPWKTWWAYSLYFLIGLVAVLIARGEIIKRARLRNEVKLKQLEAEKYHELDTLKSRFFANISHEFRTPLTLILGPLHERLNKAIDNQDKRQLSMMHRNALRLLQLVNQLLDLSKLEAGKMKLVISEDNIASFIRTIVQAFQSLAEAKKIKYNVHIPHTINTYFDAEKVENILANILSNAFKFTPADGSITVSVKEGDPASQFEEGYVEIVIEDTGIGIPKEHLNKIFDRFYQADSSATRTYEGTGIGLALAKELVDLHGGTMSVVSAEGNGTSFTVRLPKGTLHLPPGVLHQKNLPLDTLKWISLFDEEKANDSPLQKEKIRLGTILIVEDNLDLRQYLRKCLEDEYLILEAPNGKEALDMLTGVHPDLILSDLMMPDVDGMQLCRKIKEGDATRHIPVILLTAKNDSQSKIEGFKLGADDYITKPFNLEELMARIQNLIKNKH